MPNPWTHARRTRLLTIEAAIAEASQALSAPVAPGLADVSPTVVAYLAAHGLSVPARWYRPPWPAPYDTAPGDAWVAVIGTRLSDCYAARPCPLLLVQATLLRRALYRLAGGRCWHEPAVRIATAERLFLASNAAEIVTTYEHADWAWRQLWRARGTDDPDTLAAAGFGETERALLAADEEGDGC